MGLLWADSTLAEPDVAVSGPAVLVAFASFVAVVFGCPSSCLKNCCLLVSAFEAPLH